MVTRVTNTLIPHNSRIVKARKRRAADAVVPSVKGLRTIHPSVVGIAERADLIRSGITMIRTARAVSAKTGDAELAALANNPKLMKAIDAAIKRLGRQADSILRTTLATSNDDPEHLDHPGTLNTPHNSNDQSAVSGQDSAFTAWTPEAVAKREASAKRVVDLGAAIERDTFQNATRVRFGQAPVSVDNDDLYKLFEGK